MATFKSLEALQSHYAKTATFNSLWRYLRPDGSVFMVVHRFDKKDGGKFFLPAHETSDGWIAEQPNERPIPLYGANELGQHQGVVFIPEGEKCRDAVASLGLKAVTWAGGANRDPKHFDWERLRGCELAILPDMDKPGIKCADNLTKHLRSLGFKVNVIGLTGFKACDDDGKDIADWIHIRIMQGVPRDGIGQELMQCYRTYVPVESAEPKPETNGHAKPPAKTPALLLVSEIEEKPRSWLWHGRLEAGEINIVCGPPGVSKSMLGATIAAMVTNGAPWPGKGQMSRAPGSVLILSAEDSYPKTIKPRLRVAGANQKLVAILDGSLVEDKKYPITLLNDLDMIRRSCEVMDYALGAPVKLILIDPINSFLGTKLDSNNNEQVRSALEPLRDYAAEIDAAIIAILHTNKALAMNALDKVGGSRAFTALARVVSFVGKLKDQPGVNVWTVAKINNAEELGPIAYSIRSDSPDSPPMIQFLVDHDCGDVDPLDLISSGSGGRKSSVPRCSDWLRDNLPADGSLIPAAEITQLADSEGFSKRVLLQAADKLGVEFERKGRSWSWKLPPK